MMAILLKTSRESEAQLSPVGSSDCLPLMQQREMLYRHRWIASTMAPGARKAKDSVTCFRCEGAGCYSDRCTTKLCQRCGGRGHKSSKCASLADVENGSPAETMFAMVGDPGDDAEETTSF